MERWFFLLIIAVLLYLVVKLWYARYKRRREQRKRFRRGEKLERQAVKFLRKKGFKVIGSQVEFTHTYYVDKRKCFSQIVVDYLVKKNGKTYVVEVKSGSSAISVKNKDTRRQLLEYAVAIPCNGIYLLDMENKALKLVEFSL